METDYDVIILGAGLAGQAALLSLPEPLQNRALLVDAAAAPGATERPAPPGLDERGTALNRRSLDILEAWGLRSELAPAMGTIREIEVSQAGYWGITRLRDNRPVGTVVNNRLLGNALWRAIGRTNASTRFNTRVTNLRLSAGACHLQFDDTSQCSTRLLLLADGNRSGLASRIGIRQAVHDYGQTAIAFNVERSLECDGFAFERFGDGTARALLPLGGRRQSVIWVTRTNAAPDWLAQSPDAWARRLPAEFGREFGTVTTVSEPVSYPLAMKQSTELARPRIALIGNSALTLHPVAGQGFNLHLRTVHALGQHLHGQSDPGQPQALAAWQQETAARYLTMARACHGLVQSFAPHSPWFAHARGLALAATNGLPTTRARLMAFAMGYDVPAVRSRGSS